MDNRGAWALSSRIPTIKVGVSVVLRQEDKPATPPVFHQPGGWVIIVKEFLVIHVQAVHRARQLPPFFSLIAHAV